MKPVPVKQQISSGGVILRHSPEGIRVALIRRSSPKGEDVWCLPKGWVEAGESPEQTAVREVEEETGLKGRIIRKLGIITYWFYDKNERKRIHKTVHFFLMNFTQGDTSRHDHEVLEARWFGMEEAENRLAYAGERDIFKKAKKALAKPGITEGSARFLSLALAVGLLLAGCVSKATHESLLAQYRESDTRNAQLTQQLAALKAELERTRKSLGEAKDRLNAIQSSTQNQESDLALLTERNVAMSKEIEALNRRNRDLTDTIEGQKTQTENLTSQIEALEFLSKKLSGQVEQYRSEANSAEKIRQDRARTTREMEVRLRDALKDGVSAGSILIASDADRVQLRLAESALFDSGGLEINAGGREMLKNIARVATGGPVREVEVQGHTDNVPIGPRLAKTFPSNWELSTTRASRIARFLVDEAGIASGSVSATGFADTRPVADNDTPEGRALNRRIEISLVLSGPPLATDSSSSKTESEVSP
jgi:chemotaxis protein MotB